MKITPIILNYNQPDTADKLYEKLQADRFEEIISVDNGSDINPPSKHSNFRLPKNIKANGQTRMALIYCMDYFPADYYWLINTSCELLENINYKDLIQQALADIKNQGMDAGIISPALINETVIKHQKYKEQNNDKYSVCCWCENIAPLISHKLLEIHRKNKSAFFDKGVQRGWITSHELGYEAAKNKLWWVLAHKIPVRWNRNSGYKSGVGGESLDKYQKESAMEMKRILKEKFGINWRVKLYLNFLKRTKQEKLPFKVIPVDPFEVWKLFYVNFPGDKFHQNVIYRLFCR